MPYELTEYYDDFYHAADKDYKAEVKLLKALIRAHKKSKGKRLLDVACGTGLHMSLLASTFDVEGLDVEPGMLRIARKKHPGLRFTLADMRTFSLPRQFDVITCLFSAIGHMQTLKDMQKAVKQMASHLLPGGVLLVEPWFSRAQWHPGRLGSLEINKPGLKAVRMSRSAMKGKLSVIDFQYLIATEKRIEHRTETLLLGLYKHQDYMQAFKNAGLKVTRDPFGLEGRGMYIGVKP